MKALFHFRCPSAASRTSLKRFVCSATMGAIDSMCGHAGSVSTATSLLPAQSCGCRAAVAGLARSGTIPLPVCPGAVPCPPLAMAGGCVLVTEACGS